MKTKREPTDWSSYDDALKLMHPYLNARKQHRLAQLMVYAFPNGGRDHPCILQLRDYVLKQDANGYLAAHQPKWLEVKAEVLRLLGWSEEAKPEETKPAEV